MDIVYCASHAPSTVGADDAIVAAILDPFWSIGESGGESNRAWCDFVHRKER